jgi:hypothetical protein
MFVVGTSDTVVGVESSKALASAIPGAWLVQFKKCNIPFNERSAHRIPQDRLNFIVVSADNKN